MKAVFNPKEYQYRLRLLREIVSGRSQQAFADQIGIPMKTWNNYERGYPVPRETAMLLMETFEGVSTDWLWYGMTGNLSEAFKKKVKAADAVRHERRLARASLKRAKDRVKEVDAKFHKQINPTPSK